MSAKAPIYLKRRSRKGKKEKLRDLLSSDMISPPLGDFRHTIHIGSTSAQDFFGDLSFLKGKFHLLPGQPDHQGAFQLNRTASVSSGNQPPTNESSPLLKNAFSLPVIGGVQALTLPAQTSSSTSTTTTTTTTLLAPPPKPPRLHLESSSPHSSLPASPNPKPRAKEKKEEKRGEEKQEKEQKVKVEVEEEERPYLSHAGSLLSLHLDLGPSILEEVLQIMDGQRVGGINGGFAANGRQEIYT